jgi:hypothetical protein
MREYAKVGPKAWQGETFKALRKKGPEALLVGLYLMTSPSSNMLGLFAQPILYMAHETGLGEEGALKGLHACIEVGYCSYDHESEVVWVHEMARYQVAEQLKEADLRCKGIQKEYEALPKNPFLGPFFDRYAAAYHLTARREFGDARQGSLIVPYQAPSKPRAGEGAGEGERAGEGTGKPTSAAKLPTCPYEDIVAIYHELLPEFAGVRVMDDGRKKVIRECWQWILTSSKADHTRRAETPEQALDWLRQFFERARDNDFLMGRTPRAEKHKKWKPDIEYLLKPAGIKQVLEKTDVRIDDDAHSGAQG